MDISHLFDDEDYPTDNRKKNQIGGNVLYPSEIERDLLAIVFFYGIQGLGKATFQEALPVRRDMVRFLKTEMIL